MEFLNVDAANTAVIDRIKASAPVLTDVRYAKDVIVEMKNMFYFMQVHHLFMKI